MDCHIPYMHSPTKVYLLTKNVYMNYIVYKVGPYQLEMELKTYKAILQGL